MNSVQGKPRDSAVRVLALMLDHPSGLPLVAIGGVLIGVGGWGMSFGLKEVLDRTREPQVITVMGIAVSAIGIFRAVLAVVRRRIQIYEPCSGRILINGRDLREWPRDLLRRSMGGVFQRHHLFEATLAENLALGVPDLRDEELWRVLLVTGADRVVQAQPEGLHYRILREGTRLLGGQIQRLALARALVRQPRIFLLVGCP
jgi:ABC-type transport system involved in cytochrome bd biosynthesis fused ATPase/permease subunit